MNPSLVSVDGLRRRALRAGAALLLACAALAPLAAQSAAPARSGVLAYGKTAGGAQAVQVQLARLQGLRAGEWLSLLLPDGRPLLAEVTRLWDVLPEVLTFSARAADGSSVLLSVHRTTGAISGQITTGQQTWLFETRVDGATVRGTLRDAVTFARAHPDLVERAEGLLARVAPHPALDSDDEFARHLARLLERLRARAGGDKALAAGKANGVKDTIDIMLVVDADAQAAYGSTAAADTDIATIVAYGNAAYDASRVDLEMRLVKTLRLGASLAALDQIPILNRMREGVAPFTDLWREQVAVGADLVLTIVPFRNRDSDAGNCGRAALNTFRQGGSFSAQQHGYGVISRIKTATNTGSSCHTGTLVHEVGHLLGAMHTRENSGGVTGVFTYSYGYSIPGLFNDIMSASFPRNDLFANPALNCSGQPCGVPSTDLQRGADVALTFNNTGPFGAAVLDRESRLTGWYVSPAELGTGWAIEVLNGRIFVAYFAYRDDGQPVWYAGAGARCGDGARFCFDLNEFADGATAAGAFKPARLVRRAAEAVINFSAGYPATAQIAFGNKVLNLERFTFGENPFTRRPAFPALAAPGWYWDPTEGGTGFFVEYQGEQVFIGYFHYTADGRPTWAVARDKAYERTTDANGLNTSVQVRELKFDEFAGGQTLTGPFRSASLQRANVVRGFVQPENDYLSVVGIGPGVRTSRRFIRFREF
jgi:hypothetical protein